MSNFLDLNLDDVTEPRPVPKGQYELQITEAKIMESGPNSKHPGTPMIKVTLGFTDLELNAPSFNHFIVFPYDGQENDYYTRLNIKRFVQQFGCPFNGNLEEWSFDMTGKVAMCNVGLTEPREDNGAVYNQLILDRLTDTSAASGKGRATTARKRSA